MSDIKSKNIELVDIDTIVPNPKNANRHSIEQIKRLEKLIKYQGFRNPLIVSNRTGFLVVGHGRLEAAKNLGIEKLPVIKQDFENEAQEYAYLISDNEIARWAELDKHSVYNELKDLDLEDIELLGLEDFEIPDVEELDPQTDEDEVPEVEHPITRRGDIWLLGKHRLMCGDSTDILSIDKLTQNNEADMLFTDPPYGMNYSGRGEKTSNTIMNDNIDPTEFYNLMPEIKERYVWGRVENYKHLKEEPRDTIVWRKNNFGMGRGYRGQYEVCFYYGNFNGSDSDVWDIAKDYNYVHPTQKPVELCERAIKNSEPLTVLDLFGGSGSTMIACENKGITNYSMELDEKYCDVIINRWQNYTGKKATLEATGQTYEELCNERK